MDEGAQGTRGSIGRPTTPRLHLLVGGVQGGQGGVQEELLLQDYYLIFVGEGVQGGPRLRGGVQDELLLQD